MDSSTSKIIMASPTSHTTMESPTFNTVVKSPRSNTVMKSPRSNTVMKSPRSNAIVKSPRSNTFMASPTSNTTMDSPTSDAPTASSASLLEAEKFALEIDFSYFDNLGHDGFEIAIWNVMKGTTQFPFAIEAQAEHFAANIVSFVEGRWESIETGWVTFHLWNVVIQLAKCIPSDHDAQSALIQGLQLVRQREGILEGVNSMIPEDDEPYTWKDLPDFNMFMREAWIDPTMHKPDDDEDEKEAFQRWENLNSFCARLTATGYDLDFITQVEAAFENPPVEGEAMNVRLRVASDWLIRCAKTIYEYMDNRGRISQHPDMELTEEEKAMPCWDFWKKKAGDIAAAPEKLQLDSEVVDKLRNAVERMNEAEDRFNRFDWTAQKHSRWKRMVDVLRSKLNSLSLRSKNR